MANSVATVASLEGQAWAKSADGTLRPLKVGDTVTAEEVVITATGARIELDFGDGKPVAIAGGKEVLMDRNLWTELADDEQDAAVDNASVEQALTVLNEGGDLTTALEETAAGLEGGGTSEGHSFVELTRVVETTDPNAFDYGANNGGAEPSSIAASEQSNRAPLVDVQSFTGDEDTVIAGQIIATDVENDVLTYSLSGQPANGTITLDPVTGGFVYTPNANYNGPDSFIVTVTDDHGNNTTTTMNLTVTSVNDAPVASNQNITTLEDTSVTGQVVATDVEGDTLSYSVSTTAANGTVTLNPVTGAFVYTPNANFNGSDSFVVTVADGNGGFTTSKINIGVTPVNDAPVSSNQNLTTLEDTPLSGAVAASDVDNDALTYVISTAASNGTVSLDSATGAFVYTPSANYNGADSFVVTITDGNGGTTTSTINIGVTPVNDAPISADQSLTTLEDTPLSGSVGASDIEGDTLTYSLSSTVANGTITLDPVTGAFVYTPNANFNGSDSFEVTIEDGQGGVTKTTINIGVTPVNDAPVSSGLSLNTSEDTAVSGQITASDIDGDTLAYSVSGQPSNGSVSLNAATGSFVYTPNSNYNGSDSFTVAISDGNGGTTTSLVSIGISAVNDGPTAGNLSLTTAEDVAVNGSISANDPDGDTLSYSVTSNPANGTVALNPATGTFTYTPNAGYNGSDSFLVSVSDGKGGSATSKVTVGVNSLNDAPVASDVNLTTAEDTAVSGAISATDPESDPLSYSVTGNPSNGTVVLNSSTGTFVYTPNSNYKGSDSFTVTISDGNGGTTSSLVSIGISSQNDLPVLSVTSTNNFTEDAPSNAVGSVVATYTTSDADGDTVTVTLSDTVNYALDGAGNVTLTAAGLALVNSGTDLPAFTLTPNDGTINGTARNVDPAVTPETSGPVVSSITLSDTALKIGDTALVTITFSEAVTNFGNADVTVEQGTLSSLSSADGGITWTGTLTPTSNIEDASNIISVANSYTDLAGNAGTAATGPTYSVDTIAPTATISLSDSALIGGETATVTITFSEAVTGLTTADFTVGSGALSNLASSDGGVTWTATFTPAANTSDTSNVISLNANSYTDVAGNLGSGASSANYTVNNAPIAVNDPTSGNTVSTGLVSEYYSYNEGTDGGNLTSLAQINAFIATHNPNATFVAKTFDYGSDNLFSNDLGRGTNLQSFLGSDAASLSTDPGTSTDAIIRMFGAVELAAGTYNFRIRGDDGYQVKVDGVAVATVDQIQSPTGTVHTQFTVGTSGVHSIEILYWDQGGQAVFKVELSDNNGTTYDLLSAKPISYSAVHTMNEDTLWTVPVATLLANDSDPDGDTLTVLSVQNAVNGTVSMSGGNVTFTPTANFYGLATYTYTISDGNGGTDTALVTMNVQPLNDLAVVSNASANATGITFTAADADVGTTLALSSPFAAAFSNPTINNGSATTLTVTEQTTAASGTLRVTDATAPVDIIGLSIGTSGANTFNSAASTTTVALYGFGGDDVLTGGSANDVIVGGIGSDTLTGGAGVDTFNVASGTDTITDLGFGGADALVVVSGATANATLGAAYTATAATTNAGVANLSSNGFNVNLGSAGGSVGYSVTNTGAGATFTGSGLADSLTGGSGVDTLNGGAGNDTITGGAGNDSLAGGANNDTYVFGLSDGTDTITDSSGTDSINISSGGATLSSLDFSDSNTAGSSGNLVITLNGQTITVNNHFASNGNIETLTFNGGATYRGFALDNASYNLNTDDNGNRDGGTGNDIISGTTGNNTLRGNSGTDLLFGGGGNDTLEGGDGSDLLVGGSGADNLTGGTGADTFVWNLADKGNTGSSVIDTVTDFTTGNSGDKLNLSDLLQGENSGNLTSYLHFSASGSNTIVQISSSGSFNGSNYNAQTDQTIVLSNVNLTSIGNDTAIINQLKNNNNLITD